MELDYAMERRDYAKIEKLNKLEDTSTFWSDVRKLTKSVKSDHAIKRWQCLAEIRYDELVTENELDKLYCDTRF